MPDQNSFSGILKRIQKLQLPRDDRNAAAAPATGPDDPSSGSPADAPEIAFEDLFFLEDIQRLQDEFSDATGVASIITRTDGSPITRPSNFCRLCRDIIRATDKGLRNCYRSDAVIGQLNEMGPTIQPCLSGGLWDSGAGISVGGRHVANWLIGQVRDETQTEERIREYAREIGADEEEAVAAFREVPAMTYERYQQISRFLFTLAKQLSETAYRNLQRARHIELREQAEEALRRSQALHRDMIDNLPDLVWLKDQDGVYVSCNRALARLFGAPQEEIIGKTDYDFSDKDEADFFRLHDRKAAEAGTATINEEWLTFAADGYRGLFETVKTPLFDENGALRGVLGIARDVTARTQTEQDLRESEERFRALHNASFGGIAIHDKGVILECNQGLSAMTGYSVEELIGMDGLLLIAERDREFVVQKIASGAEQPYEAYGRRRNGEEFPMRLEGRNIPYKGKQVRTVEFRDLTEIKQVEAEQRRLQEQLNHALKMESVGQLAGGIAHDFNNLLQVILGFGEVTLDAQYLAAEERESLEQIMKAGERARTLVSQLLAFSRRQVLDMKEIDLNEVIADMLKILRRVIGEHIELGFRPGRELGAVLADSGQLGQILTNLCVNSRDAMPNGGALTIATEAVRVLDANRDRHFWIEPGDYVVLRVADTGHGIEASLLDQVFEPFFTTKDVGEGTGLGLSTVYGLVQQHHGSIHVQSEVGRGTTFHVYLPVAERTSPTAHATPESRTHGGSETILLAEDDDMVRKLTGTLLRQAGYTVITARNGLDALTLYDRHADRIDLLLLDVVMPKMGGREVYDRLRAIRPDLPAIFASGYSMNAVHTDFVLDEGLVLVQKPARREELLRKVREVLDGARRD